MRRDKPISVRVRAPSRGLITRWPGESGDLLVTGADKFSAPGIANRSASVASNVRYEDGVVCNAPGYDRVELQASILEDIVSHWRLDEAPGQTRKDATLNHHDLAEQTGLVGSTITNVEQTVGKIKSAAEFAALAYVVPPVPTIGPAGSPISSAITFPTVSLGSTDATGHRAFIYGQIAGPVNKLQVINTSTDTQVALVTPPGPFSASGRCYAESSQKAYFGYETAAFTWAIYDLSGSNTGTLDLSAFDPGFGISTHLAYGRETDRVYAAGEDGASNMTIFVVNPADNTHVDHVVDMSGVDGGNTFNGGRIMYAPGYLFFDYVNRICVVRLSDFTAVASLVMTNGFGTGFCYNPVNGKVYFSTFQDTTNDVEIWEVSFPTMTVDFAYVLPSLNQDFGDLIYDPTQLRLVVNNTTGDIAVLDPATRTIVDTLSISVTNGVGVPYSFAFDENLGKFYIPDGANSQVLIYQ